MQGYPYPRDAGIPDPTLGRTTTGSTGNGYTRGSGRVGSGNNLLATGRVG